MSVFLFRNFFSNADDLQTNFDKHGEYVEGEVLMKMNDSKVDVDTFAGKAVLNTMEVVKNVDTKDVFKDENIVLMGGNGESTQSMIASLRANPLVEYVEPNYIRRLSAIPNDTSAPTQPTINFAQQWGLNNTGQTISGNSVVAGTADADIDAPEAYDLATGGTNVVVAVLDTGVLMTHEDLVDNLWDGSGGCKDENNVTIGGGCPNHGYDFVNSDNNPTDDKGHGTFVSGILGAKGNNAKGISGVSQTTKIMAVKFLDNLGSGSTANEIKAINFAKNNGATVINASFAGTSFSQAEKDAIDAFPGLVITAAGNCGDASTFLANGCSIQNQTLYPASYTSTNIIAVAATDQNDALAGFSNHDATAIDLAAPGVNILSSYIPGNADYAFGDGTSAATPFVAGAASLLWNYNHSLTAAQVKSILLTTGDTKAGLSGNTATGKRLNIFSALSIFAPVAGYSADNVIPAVDVSQASDGTGIVTIPFRVKDGFSGLPVTLNSFEYSVDGGSTFNTPVNGDSSAALSTSWANNSYVTASDFTSTIYTFTFNTKHADVTGFADTDQSDIKFRFKVNDGAVSSAFVVSEAFRVDLSKPDVTGLSNDPVSSTSKNWAWDSTDVGAVFRFSIDQSLSGVPSGSYSSAKTTTYNTGDGTFYIHVQSKDALGNESVVSTASFIMDHTGANILGLTNDIVPAKTKTWTWSSSDPAATFGYSVDESLSGVPTGGYGSVLTTSQLSGNGTFYLHVRSRDLLGVESAVNTVSAILDNTAPVITGITNDATVTNSKTWNFTSTDLSTVTYRYLIDQDLSGVPTGDFTVQSGVTKTTGDGTFFIHLQARDALGQTSDVATASFVMDTTPPSSVSLSGVPSSTTATGIDVTVSGTDIVDYQYKIDGDSFSSNIAVATHITASGLGTGGHTLTVKGRDAAGNYQSSNTVESWTITSTGGGGGGGGGGGSGSSTPKPVPKPDKHIVAVDVPQVPVVVAVAPFADLKNHWSEPFVDKLYELGVVKGKGEANTFAPDDKLTRAELIKIALLTFSYKNFVEQFDGFKDVKSAAWYYSFVVKAFKEGIVGGYKDGTFHPDSPVTRAEALKILLLAAKIDLSQVDLKNTFSDIKGGVWYEPYVYFAFNAGIVNGKAANLFAPNDFVTRGEMAKMAVKTLDFVNAVKS